jgi:hypothetical protein
VARQHLGDRGGRGHRGDDRVDGKRSRRQWPSRLRPHEEGDRRLGAVAGPPVVSCRHLTIVGLTARRTIALWA